MNEPTADDPAGLSASPPHGDASATSIGDLAAIDMPRRWATLVRDTEASLTKVTKTATHWPVRSDKQAIPRLGWALASNLTKSEAGDRPGIRGYLDRWPAQMSVAAFIAAMDAQLAGGDSSYLSELLLSAGCEQRDDWQHPDCRPVDRTLAELYFACVYARDTDRVQAFLRSRFADRAGRSDDLANEAWARVFADYWSANAQRRFLGLGRISTLVCEVGRYAALDALRAAKRNRSVSIDENTSDESKVADLIGVTIDPSRRLAGSELRRTIKECLAALPVRTALIAEAVWFQEIAASAVAKRLKISESAVSQQLNKARESLRNHLVEKGFTAEIAGR